MAVLLCQERSTITNLICTNGGQHHDWTADYRLYSKGRSDMEALFAPIIDEVLLNLKKDEPLVVALDDTLLRKTGARIDGVSWRRDPLGPAFQTNLVRAQRFLQMSAAWPLEDGSARMIPIVFEHVPSAQKPSKNATEEELKEHRERLKQQCLNVQGLQQMQRLRHTCPPSRHIVFCGDGSYTNARVIKELPEGCTYIGRIRKDAKLFHPPQPAATGAKLNGRPRRFGAKAPTPEELRTDESSPWQTVQAFAAGKSHAMRIKTLDKVLWRKSGTKHLVRIVVMAPLGYRLRKGSKLLYRQPAFLLCTDPNLSLEQLVQYYLWRWGIEVNFREEKTLLGTGDAQVRTPESNRQIPAMVVAAYSLLWLAALKMHRRGDLPSGIPHPKWRAKTKECRILPSTGDLLRTLRGEIWARAIRPGTFYNFMTSSPDDKKSSKPSPNLPATLLAAA